MPTVCAISMNVYINDMFITIDDNATEIPRDLGLIKEKVLVGMIDLCIYGPAYVKCVGNNPYDLLYSMGIYHDKASNIINTFLRRARNFINGFVPANEEITEVIHAGYPKIIICTK